MLIEVQLCRYYALTEYWYAHLWGTLWNTANLGTTRTRLGVWNKRTWIRTSVYTNSLVASRVCISRQSLSYDDDSDKMYFVSIQKSFSYLRLCSGSHTYQLPATKTVIQKKKDIWLQWTHRPCYVVKLTVYPTQNTMTCKRKAASAMMLETVNTESLFPERLAEQG